MQLIYVEWNYIYTGWRPVCVCVCMFKRKWLCVCVFWERGGGMGSNSYTLASRAAVQSAPGFPGNALIKPACRRFAVQSTHASWGLYLENQKKEHFTVSPLQSWKYNSHQLACLFLFGIYKFFLPFHARIVLQKKKDKKTPRLILGLCHKLMRKDTPTSVLRTGAKENQLQFFSVHFSQRKDLDHPGKVKSTYRLFLSREGRSNSPRFHA